MPSTVPSGHRVMRSLLAAVDRPLELLFRHPGAAFDPHPLCLVVELLLRAAFRAIGARAKAPAAARRDVPGGAPGRRLRLAASRALLVDRPRGDLLRLLLRRPALLERLLDVLVLAFPLCRPCLLRHANHLLMEVNEHDPDSVTRLWLRLERLVLDVVLGRVGVRELIDDIHAVAVGVVDAY